MAWENYYRIMLALTAWREARGEGREGMRAVLHVIRNRVNKGWGDWDHVVTKKWQFSSLTAPGDSQLVRWPDSPDEKFALAMQLADAVYDGTDPDITGGAVYYANLKYIDKGGSFERLILGKPREHPVVARIGEHTFFA